MMQRLSVMSPAFTGYNYNRDIDKMVQKARALGLTPIIEELAELKLKSSAKKVKDDTAILASRIPKLEAPSTVKKNLQEELKAAATDD